MEILSNFNSIYCFITFIIGAVFMLAVLPIVAIDILASMGILKEPRNKVHFYVSCEKVYYRNEIVHTLWIGKPYYTEHRRFMPNAWGRALAVNASIAEYNLNYSDFTDMKEGEIREVFINLEN